METISSLACEVYVLPIEIWTRILMTMYHMPPTSMHHLRRCVKAIFWGDGDLVFYSYMLPSIQWLPIGPVVPNDLLMHCSGLTHLRLRESDKMTDAQMQRMTNLQVIDIDTTLLYSLMRCNPLPKLKKLALRDPVDGHHSADLGYEVDQCVPKLTGLSDLTCSHHIRDPILSELTSLQNLHLEKSLVMGRSFSCLPHLTSLTVDKCLFVSTTEIACLTNLRRLSLYYYEKNPNVILGELASLTQLESILVFAKSPIIVRDELRRHWTDEKIEVRPW